MSTSCDQTPRASLKGATKMDLRDDTEDHASDSDPSSGKNSIILSSGSESSNGVPSNPTSVMDLSKIELGDDRNEDEGYDDDDAASDAGSTCSSTYEFTQEPFETYKDKIIQLCRVNGYGEPSQVDRMEGGSFNRVIGLTLDSGEHPSCILRIPRFPKDEQSVNDIIDEVSVLQYVKKLDVVHVPSVLAYDFTTNNALESQYVLQERIPGKQLQEVFYNLPLSEKLQITKLVAEIITKLEATVLEKPGRLVGKRNLPSVSTAHALSDGEIVITGYRKNGVSDQPMVPQQPLVGYLTQLLENHKIGWDEDSDVVEMLDELQIMAKQMAKAGFVHSSDNLNVLWHWDINSRNVLIQPKAKNPDNKEDTSVEWEVTGVLDWDDAMSVPLVISRKPPSWIWFDEEIRTRQWTGDRDTKPERDLTEDELFIKACFDQEMTKNSPSWHNDAYHRGPWLRRLAKFALQGFKVAWDWDKQKKLVEEWKEYYESLGLESEDEDNGEEDNAEDRSEIGRRI